MTTTNGFSKSENFQSTMSSLNYGHVMERAARDYQKEILEKEDFDEDDALKDFGAEVVTRLCEQLIQGGAPALHFYTLNQSKPSARILDNLGF